MARPRRRAVRARSSVARNRGWVSTLVEASQAAGTFTGYNLVQPSDYEIAATSTKALLETIYLELTLSPQGSAVAYAIAGIVALDTDQAATDPDNVGHLSDERWLWTMRTIVPGAADGVLRYPVHVKQKVKLDDAKIMFIMSNSGAASFDFSFHSRSLVRVS